MGIYAIQLDSGPVKIGYTANDPRLRRATIQSHHAEKATLIGFMSGSRADEKSIHLKLLQSHIRGEWFNPTNQVLSFIKAMPPLPNWPDGRGKSINSRGHCKIPSKKAREMQEASVASRTKGRMPFRSAKPIWFDSTLSTAQALKKMRGWSKGTAYRAFGKRGTPSGRPKLEH